MGAVPTVWIAIQAILEKEPQWDISSIRCIPDRRLGGAEEPDRGLRQEVRGLHAPRLGHDRDVAARQRVPAALVHGQPSGGGALRRPRQAGCPRRRRRHSDRRRRGARAAVGRQERRRDPRARTVGDERVLQQLRRAPSSSPRTAGSAPATWPSIDPDGYIQITDRTKDLIKSGGEWISSVDMETTIMGHPKVLEAAVIAVPHESGWSGRSPAWCRSPSSPASSPPRRSSTT